jgi:hypothetical protein
MLDRVVAAASLHLPTPQPFRSSGLNVEAISFGRQSTTCPIPINQHHPLEDLLENNHDLVMFCISSTEPHGRSLPRFSHILGPELRAAKTE